MLRLAPVVFLAVLLAAAASPVRQLGDFMDDFASALESPSPSPSVVPDVSSSPMPSPSLSAEPSPSPSFSPLPSGDSDVMADGLPIASVSPLPSATSEEESVASVSPLPSPTPSASVDETTTVEETPDPNQDALIPWGDVDSEDDEDDEDEYDQVEEETSGEGAEFKSVDAGAVAAPGSISAIALVGIAVAILAPAVLIYWVVRRRNQDNGFENMPEAETNTYRGPSHDTFTVA